MPSHLHATPKARGQALRLRRNLTEAEKLLWSKLRRNQLSGHYFRRQMPVGHFVADFGCAKAMLIVEVDGGQHADNPRDLRRTEWLEHQGYRVLRFWNNEVLGNLAGVIEVILAALESAQPPSPPSP
jgi:very-short-patch-repair endonuclease